MLRRRANARSRPPRPPRAGGPTIAAAAALAVLGPIVLPGGLAGCSGGPERTHHVGPDGRVRAGVPAAVTRDLTATVAPTGPLLAWERSPSAPPRTGRFEYDRRTAGLNPREPRALRATLQWPTPLGPPERPIRFERWDQD